jgi:molybdate transport system substrate-binding protein
MLLWCGCGGSGKPALLVSAAASLKAPFTQYAARFSSSAVRYSFAGSDALAAQIEQGLRPDVFASADTQLPQRLFAAGLARRPVVFAANTLVLAVRAHASLFALGDIERPGARVALGTPGVPVGAYAAAVIARLAPVARSRLLANVHDREPDVTGIVGKLLQGAVDAGFLYATDARAAGGALRAIPLPVVLQPRIAYAAVELRGAPHPVQARAFIAGLLTGPGREALRGHGFLPPPSP